ncbi:carboxypeptidase-like regulatory domain-containing protein [Flavobacterium kingsejongi]|uniref:carboxypeptidase-like regulatory domain-containing protein n=1 Tax=Flavobacterium kingsejongi TaxID=1678728 RepID=UPI001D131696|nr:carboxypeptidase-like regulatory domain-containing protein [Flavobacterium kingsejongi]
MGNLLFNVNQWNKKAGLFLLLLLFASVSSLKAQNISGVVSDAKGMTIPGVSVTVKNTQEGTTTDIDGKYEIKAASNAVLVFSFIGFKTQEIAVNGKKQISIVLAENTESLDEVVVIGYGKQKKSDINGSISSIKAEELQNIPQVSIDQMM